MLSFDVELKEQGVCIVHLLSTRLINSHHLKFLFSQFNCLLNRLTYIRLVRGLYFRLTYLKNCGKVTGSNVFLLKYFLILFKLTEKNKFIVKTTRETRNNFESLTIWLLYYFPGFSLTNAHLPQNFLTFPIFSLDFLKTYYL